MKILLCSTPVEAPGDTLLRARSEGPIPIMPKTAIVSLIYWMRKNGYPDCDFYDIDMLYPTTEEVENAIREYKPDIVGLSAVVSTQYAQVKHLSKLIKKINPNTVVVCGGYLTAAANVILRKTEVDICVNGNGEIVWVDILNHIKKFKKINIKELSNIQGVMFIDDNDKLVSNGKGETIPQEQMPYPDYDLLKTGLRDKPELIENYFRDAKYANLFHMDERFYDGSRGKMLATLFTTKGCVAKCTFCQRAYKGYYVMDLDALDEHMSYLKKHHNVGHILLRDENFGSNLEHAKGVARVFTKHNMLWSASGIRATSINREVIDYFKEHNCSFIQFGIETGSQMMLDVMEKKLNIKTVEERLNDCFENKMYPPVSLLLGMPGETNETVVETAHFVSRICSMMKVTPETLLKYSGLDVFYAVALPGTPLYDWAKITGKYGTTLDELEDYLLSVSNIGAYKRYYYNFSGASMSDVIFWDILIKVEASRYFRKLMKNIKIDHDLTNKFKGNYFSSTVKNPHHKLRFGAGHLNVGGKKQWTQGLPVAHITNFLESRIIYNKIFDIIPSKIFYPILRFSLYLEYLINKKILKNQNNLYSKFNDIKPSDKSFSLSDNLKEMNKKSRSLWNLKDNEIIKSKAAPKATN